MALKLSVVGGLCSFIDFGKVMLIYTSWEPAWQIQWVGSRSDIARSSCPRWNHFNLESHYGQEQKFAKEPARSTFISQWNRCISSHNNVRETPFILILYCCPFFFRQSLPGEEQFSETNLLFFRGKSRKCLSSKDSNCLPRSEMKLPDD